MNLVYRLSESTIKPKIVDVQATTVYIRKDIIKEIRDNVTFYIYKEAVLTHEEFNIYATEQVYANAVKGINDSDNIAKLVVNDTDNTDNQLILMEAIADLYDVIASMM